MKSHQWRGAALGCCALLPVPLLAARTPGKGGIPAADCAAHSPAPGRGQRLLKVAWLEGWCAKLRPMMGASANGRSEPQLAIGWGEWRNSPPPPAPQMSGFAQWLPRAPSAVPAAAWSLPGTATRARTAPGRGTRRVPTWQGSCSSGGGGTGLGGSLHPREGLGEKPPPIPQGRCGTGSL